MQHPDMTPERREYLKGLAEEHGVNQETVFELALMLGPNEDYDGLVTMVEDIADEEQWQ